MTEERTLEAIAFTVEVFHSARTAFSENITSDMIEKNCDFLQSQGAMVAGLKKQVKEDFNWLVDHYIFDNGNEPERLARRIVEVL